MLFTDLSEPQPDPILGLARQFAADLSPDKVDMGIGVYKDADGNAPVLRSVKTAEQWLATNQPSKVYLSSAGNPDYNGRIGALVLGGDAALLDRAATVQTPGGTGALKVIADFLKVLGKIKRVFVSDPTWPNHVPLFSRAGHEIARYAYYDPASGQVRFAEMLDALKATGPGDAVILHGCCHNPTGADLSAEQWRAVADVLAATGATPIVDLAYLGFANGLDVDNVAVRTLAAKVPELLVASSCSKNFALYRDRVGAVTIIGGSNADAARALGHLMPVIRTNYSMPPDHGAAVVAHILGDADLRAQWQGELTAMRTRLNDMRARFAEALSAAAGADYGYLAHQRGMFAQLSIPADSVKSIREQRHIHLSSSGRVNLAALTPANLAYVADGVGAFLRD